MSKIFLLVILSLYLFGKDNCVISSYGNKICFEFELDKIKFEKNKTFINDIAGFCFSKKYDRLILEDIKSINNGDRYTIKVLTNNSNDKFDLDLLNNNSAILKNCTKQQLKSNHNSKRLCYSIKNSDLRKICLDGIGSNACNNLNNSTLRLICSKGYSYCSLLNNSALRGVCQNGKSYCNMIDDSEMRSSCQHYQGDMLFWIIMASEGYIIKQH